MGEKRKLISAAIDFGTTYSGWAFSFNHQYDKEPTQVFAKQWVGSNCISVKAPTTILIKPDGKTLESFGYDAEDDYVKLVSADSHRAWYYFRRFKMLLHGKMTFDRNLKLEDETQKSLPAMRVFSLVIQCMVNDLLKNGRDQLSNSLLKIDDIMWVLTVPAIWDDAAKQFMREAAVMAGINEENVMLSLEPETASIFCCLLPVNKKESEEIVTQFELGSKHMLIDAGGGTVDITVHEMLHGGHLKEIHRPSGGAWGGTQVDDAFKQFLISVFGSTVILRFETECKEDYLEVFRDFELKKRKISPECNTDVTLRFPLSLREIFHKESGKEISNAISQTRFAGQVFLSGDKLRVKADLIKNLFFNAIQSIVSHVKDLMKNANVRQVSTIVMVGGFSESQMLQVAIRSNFSPLSVVIPQEPALAVLKGAVIFGHNPSKIVARVCRYTYGICTTVPFDKNVHDISKMREYSDGPYCIDIFSKHVEAGQTVALNDWTEEHSYAPFDDVQTSIGFPIFASITQSPMYVTDEGCVKLGKMVIHDIDMTVPYKQRSFATSMCFGGTVINVTAKEKATGKIAKVTVNFLG